MNDKEDLEYPALPSPMPNHLKAKVMELFWSEMVNEDLEDQWLGFECDGRDYDINASQEFEEDPVSICLYPCATTEDGHMSTDWSQRERITEVTTEEIQKKKSNHEKDN
tara:strand:+ start:288 stop:614 length:327 start_codon:yes stop_codon:yes gene_type:complete